MPSDPSELNDPSNLDEDLEIDVVERPTQQRPLAAGLANSNSQQPSMTGTNPSQPPCPLLPLDAAILKSIELCPAEELKRKMFGCILLVGGGTRIRGLDKYLRGRLALQVRVSLCGVVG